MENTNKGFTPTRAIKKALAVLMTFVMVLSCWVFAPEMFLKAEAANDITSGNYNVKVIIHALNGFDNNGSVTVKINYQDKNGWGTSGSDSTTISSNNDCFDTNFWGTSYNKGEKTTEVYSKSVSWFPTSVVVSGTKKWSTGDGKFGVEINIGDEIAYAESSKFNGSDSFSVTCTVATDKKPKATEVICVTAPSTSLTIPEPSASSKTLTHITYCNDQYGVRLGYDPTVTITGDDACSGAVTSTTTQSTHTVTVTNASLMDNNNSSKTITLKSSYTLNGQTKSCSHNITLNDPTYTFTFKNTHGSTTLSPANNETSTSDYGHTYGTTPAGTRTGFTFKGYYLGSDTADSYDTDNTSGKTKLTSSTKYYANSTWYAAWQANKYTATYSYQKTDGTTDATSKKQTDYYGRTLNFPVAGTDIPNNFIVGDYKQIFKHWAVSGSTTATTDTTMQASNKTYTAVYDTEIVSADYTLAYQYRDLIKALQATQKYTEGGYTDASVNAINAAMTAMGNINGLDDDETNNVGYSQQANVDTVANQLKIAYDNAELKKFTVLFLDEQGNILPGGYYFVEYGTTTVTAPSITTKAYDETYHYINGQWDTAMSDSLSDLSYITKDLRYFAKFDAVEHTYTNSANWQTIASTCSSAGQIIKTCDEATCDHTITVDNESSDPAHHVWMATYTVDIPATCTTPGSKSKHCVNCGISDLTTSTSVPATGHAWDTSATGADADGWVTIAAATCTRAGQKQRTCSTCNYTEFDTIDATGVHNYQFESTIAATCNTAGYDVYLCTMCQAIERRNKTSALGHNWKTDADTDSNGWKTIVESSCVTEGFKERQCERCLAKETEVLPVAAHTVPDDYTTITAATCTVKGEEAKFCTVCNAEIENTRRDIDKLGHDYVEQVNIPATCQQSGLKVEVCSRCSDTVQTPSAQLEHHMVKDNTGSQTATCTLSGYDKMVCDNDIDGQPCGYTEYINMVNPLGHIYVTTPDFTSLKAYGTAAHTGDEAYFEYTPADCTHAAYWTLTCKRDDCGNTVIVRDEDHGATQHTWVLNTTATDGEGNKLTYPATCETDGQNYYECSNPNCEAIKKEDVPKLGHDWGKWEITTPATNDTDGVMTRTCSRGCTETAPIPKGEHEFDMENPYDVTPATCYSTGSQKFGCKTHTDCGVYIEVTIPMTPHDIRVESQAETCTENGYVLTYCSCWTEEQIADYFEDGTAGQCSFEPVLTETYATGHDYDYDNGVTTPPTCTEDGKTVYTCTRCEEGITGHTTTVTIPKLGHDYAACSDANYTPATCMNGGYWSCECSRCDDVNIIRNENDPSTGHVWIVNSDTDADGWKVTTQPTCTTDGEKARTCKYDCGTTETATVSALGHDFDATIEGNVTISAPTCTTEGTQTVKCSRCDVTETTTLSVLGHDWIVALENRTSAYLSTFTPAAEDAAYIRYVGATCAHGGYWELICKRDACGAVYTVTNYDNDPASNVPHTWNMVEGADADGWVTDTAATCVTDGAKHRDCTVCNLHETAVIDALGHDFDDSITENVTTVDPTCIKDGSKTVKCSRCEETSTSSIAATGVHVYGRTEVTAPTCVDAGYTTYYCTADPNCTVSYRDNATAPLGHDFADEWTLDVHPTCTETGLQSRHCKRDGCTAYVDQVVIGATGHTYGDWEIITKPTCTQQGSKKHTCTNSYYVDGVLTRCTHTETEPVSALAHQWQEGYTTDVTPTCHSEGQKSIHCGVCGTIKEGSIVVIPMYDHNYSETWTTEAQPTCTAEGREYRECTNEGCTAKDYRAIAALGHDMDMDVIIKTGTADNRTYKWDVYQCRRCNGVCVKITIFALANNTSISGATVSFTDMNALSSVCVGTTDASGAYTSVALTDGKYSVYIRDDVNYYEATGDLTVTGDEVTGTINKLAKTNCGHCSCHKSGVFAKLKRWLNTFFSVIFNRTIKCCDDMEWYGSWASKLK